jgi:hypothetical protein
LGPPWRRQPSQGWVRDREHYLHVNWLEVASQFTRGVEVDAHAYGMPERLLCWSSCSRSPDISYLGPDAGGKAMPGIDTFPARRVFT